jgi:hypothetical protein
MSVRLEEMKDALRGGWDPWRFGFPLWTGGYLDPEETGRIVGLFIGPDYPYQQSHIRLNVFELGTLEAACRILNEIRAIDEEPVWVCQGLRLGDEAVECRTVDERTHAIYARLGVYIVQVQGHPTLDILDMAKKIVDRVMSNRGHR